jgi:hypothetical protein
VNSDSLKQTKISCNIDTSLKNLTISIQSFGEVVVESKPCELIIVRKKNKQAQIMVADLPPMSVDNIHLNLNQRVSIKGENIRGCSLLPDGRMVFACYNKNIVTFCNKEGVEIIQIVKDKTVYRTHDLIAIPQI